MPRRKSYLSTHKNETEAPVSAVSQYSDVFIEFPSSGGSATFHVTENINPDKFSFEQLTHRGHPIDTESEYSITESMTLESFADSVISAPRDELTSGSPSYDSSSPRDVASVSDGNRTSESLTSGDEGSTTGASQSSFNASESTVTESPTRARNNGNTTVESSITGLANSEFANTRDDIIAVYKEITDIMRKATRILEDTLKKAEQTVENEGYIEILQKQKQAAILINEMLDSSLLTHSHMSLQDFKGILKLTLIATKVLTEDWGDLSATETGSSQAYMELVQLLLVATETMQSSLDTCKKRENSQPTLARCNSSDTQRSGWSTS
ncbi:uncharacterized protein LOC144350416 [Saccoglossus kowalevskii]